MSENRILIGGNQSSGKVWLNAAMANRHGLIAGATGTGKTVSLQVLAEGFSDLGVPVFTADVKGDLSGIAQAGTPHEKIQERLNFIGIENFQNSFSPTLFWDLYHKSGHPIRTTVSEMGPVLLSNILDLNETQEGVLQVAFSAADDEGLLLLDLKDLKALLTWIADNRAEVSKEYGNVSTASIAAIQRRLLVLSEAGGENFFGEPALKIEHLMQKDFSGKGVVSILDATQLINNSRLYATFLLWLLSELFEELDEVGDLDVPRLVFFFDEAHLLFESAPKQLIEKIEQVVRLIRSKGVGIYFVTQHPLDIPDEVLGQLGHRIQHALRAFTPRDKKAVATAASTFRQNPNVDAKKAITELGVGEALVSVLDDDGKPTMVEQVLVSPPHSTIGPARQETISQTKERSPLRGVYDEGVDRESAYELLKKRAEELAKQKEQEPKKKASRRQGPVEAFFKSMVRSIGYSIGRSIARGVLGSIAGSGRR